MSSRSPEAVELFAFAPPSRPHVDVAIFAFGGQRTLGEVRAHAAQLGCDGVVIHSMIYATAALVVDAASCIVYTTAPTSTVSMQQAAHP